MELPCNIERLLPHEPPMLLVERLLERTTTSDGDDEALLETTVPLAGPFISKGKVIPEYYIELAAQAIAGVDGFDSRLEGKAASEGFLVGVDDFEILSLAAPGCTLRVALKKEFSFNGVQIFATVIQSKKIQVASGQIRIWENLTT